MSLLKKAVVILVAVVLMIVVAGWLLPKHYQVERSIVINAPATSVYGNIVDLKAWTRWGVWFQRDPQMDMSYSGPDRAIGSQLVWKSDSQGRGKIKVTALEHNRRVVYELYFPEHNADSGGSFLLEPVEEGTRVTWANDGNVGNNPFDRYLLLMIEPTVGTDLETGLQNLKTVVENER